MLPTIRYAVNTSGIDKNWDFELLTTQFKDTTGSIEDVIRHVKAGHAICAGTLGNRRREKANVTGSNSILVDIDNSKALIGEDGKPIKGDDNKAIKVYDPQLTIQQALEHPVVRDYCALIYTTASHTDDWHKFRLVFVLPEFIKDVTVLEETIKFLLELFPHDPACKDACRVFYGSTKAKFPLINPHAVLPADWIAQATVAAEIKKQETEQRLREWEQNKHRYREYSTQQGWNIDELVLVALGYIRPRCPGSGTYDESFRVLAALKNHYGAAQAEVIGERWSPSIPGNDWQIGKMLRRMKRDGINIGTLFHIAKQYGFRFPSPKNIEVGEPDAKFYADYIAWEKYQEETEELIAEEQSKQSILDIFTKLRTKVNGFSQKFNKQPEAKSNPKDSIIEYTPGNLPTLDKSKGWNDVKIVFKAEHRHQIWAEAIDKGYKNVLDNSHTGAGKSHAIGEFKYEQCSQQFYLAADHRNPTTKTIQDNYVDLVVRHNGLKYDDTRKTPNGKDFLVWPKAGERPDTWSNCPRQPIFSVLASKNIDEEGKHGAVCQTCSLANICKNSGYKSQRRQVLGRKYIRAHPDSLPRVSDANAYNDEESTLDYSNSIMFWEEPGRLLKTSQTITVKLLDLDQVMGMIENANPESFNALQPLRIALRSLFNGDVERKRYGYDDKAFKALLPSKEEFIEHITKFGFNGSSLIETLLGILKPDLSFLKEEENRLKRDDSKNNNTPKNTNENAEKTPEQLTLKLGSEFKPTKQPTTNAKKRTKENKEKKESNRASKTEKFVDQVLRRESRKEMHEVAKDLPLNWLPTFLLIMYYGQSGAFTFDWGKLTVHSKSNTHLDLVREAKANIFVDATLSRNLLARKLEVEPNEVLLIEEEKPDYSNLTITQVDGMGQLTRQRADSMKDERIPALKSYLQNIYKDDIAFFDHKVHAGSKDGYHFRDNRGVNRFENISAIASFGIPYSNLGVLKAEFQLLYGYCPQETVDEKGNKKGDEKFDAYVDELVRGEIIQNVGRLRANRTDAQKTYYSIADYDISFLAEYFPGATIKTIPINDICMDAANNADKTAAAIMEAIKKNIVIYGDKLPQRVVAFAAGVTQSAVSKFASKRGGWEKLLKIFQLLYKSFNSTRNNLKDLDEDARRIAQQCFPELVNPPNSEPDPDKVVMEVIKTAKTYGAEKLLDILSATSLETRVGILICFIQTLPDYMRQQFIDMAKDTIFEPIEGF